MKVPILASAADGALATLLAHRERFLGFLQRRLPAAVAEDLLQSAYLRAFERGVPAVEPERQVAWFFRVLRNAVIDHVRQQARRRRLDDELAHAPVDPDPVPAGDARPALATVIATLPPTYRDALATVYVDGGSLASLAARAGISANAARVRLHRARRALGEVMCSAGHPRAAATPPRPHGPGPRRHRR